MKDMSLYDDVGALESYLDFPSGSLSGIPIYARVAAVDAILKVKKMEETNLFRSGLYYIVLVDLCGHTAFNAKYGNDEGDIRVEWFQTCVIQSIGEIEVSNYAAFCKTIGDASLLIFSSFQDVYLWSEQLSKNLISMSGEYPEHLQEVDIADEEDLDQMITDFTLRARRLVHLGEVSYIDRSDPLCLAVSQIFKIEKNFSEESLGCTQAVADASRHAARAGL
jgi:hypothetical protein